jgi:predicted metalloendopeptidase
MVGDIRTAFEDSLPTLPWIDPASAAIAREKAQAIEQKIGYPPWVRDPAALMKHYSGLEVGGLHFGNTLSSIESSNARSLAEFDGKVDTTKW